ncbi:MAG: alanine--tRNA ligase, partial [Flavobacteriales bacterium]|nr:alanine--tRNA ligase [Flavobacteriales bacterium]
KSDPTLLFINAGMNQFKDYFLGNENPEDKRVANFQKCLRVSGKHNDLDEVGADTYHHTLFEMMGNWSFGDYFKKEAIEWAWDLMTNHFKLDQERLYVTVFEGDKVDGLDVDQEAIDIWKSIIPEDRILLFDKKDNFWEMGDTGPCGPCSEIHIDLRSDEEIQNSPSAEMVNKDHPQVIELWNLVFIQYERKKDGSLVNLPKKHIDTGMGFERLVRVLQNKKSNYDTDLFLPLIKRIEELSKKKYVEEDENGKAFRVLADHARAITFTIADGQLPSNNGAGYVIRRILRRAVRYAYSFLDINEPFLYELSKVIIDDYKDYYPELGQQSDFLLKVIQEEEAQFYKTLSRGIQLFNKEVQGLSGKTLSGSFAFELFDTFGFPFDLTLVMAEERGLEVDQKGFDEKLQEQKQRSRASGQIDASDWVIVSENEKTEFLGYDSTESECKITKYREVVQKGKHFYHVVLDRTPFYPEGGGQVGDKGILRFGADEVKVFDTKKENNLIIHCANALPNRLEIDGYAYVNSGLRNETAKNHSATHLLHYALRTVLGDHVEQRGSLVNADYLRFDFSHFQATTEDELNKINELINKLIMQNVALEEYRQISLSEAQEMGAMALFGEKYGDTVRVIKFGESKELCGGIHVPNTGTIGSVKILSEGSVAAGVRRIEAISGKSAIDFYNKEIASLNELRGLLKNNKDPQTALETLISENSALKKEIEDFQKDKAAQVKDDLLKNAQEINGLKFVAQKVDIPSKLVKDLAFQLKSLHNNLMLVIGSENQGKLQLTIALSKELVDSHNLDASKMIKDASKVINGGGGGQNHYATAGGSKPSGFEEAVAICKSYL